MLRESVSLSRDTPDSLRQPRPRRGVRCRRHRRSSPTGAARRRLSSRSARQSGRRHARAASAARRADGRSAPSRRPRSTARSARSSCSPSSRGDRREPRARPRARLPLLRPAPLGAGELEDARAQRCARRARCRFARRQRQRRPGERRRVARRSRRRRAARCCRGGVAAGLLVLGGAAFLTLMRSYGRCSRASTGSRRRSRARATSSTTSRCQRSDSRPEPPPPPSPRDSLPESRCRSAHSWRPVCRPCCSSRARTAGRAPRSCRRSPRGSATTRRRCRRARVATAPPTRWAPRRQSTSSRTCSSTTGMRPTRPPRRTARRAPS